MLQEGDQPKARAWVLALALVSSARASCVRTEDLGCLADAPNVLRGWKRLGNDGDAMDIDLCAQLCSDHGFPLAGVEYGHQCFCDHEVHANKPRNSTGCTMPCSANASETCGGNLAVNVYKYACAGPATPTPAPPPPTPRPPPTPYAGAANLCPDFGRDYCDPALPLARRVSLLLGRMTAQDKMDTMAERGIAGTWPADGSPLVARPQGWWNEALHGLRNGCVEGAGSGGGALCATQFAEANAMSCAWNASLWRATADAISTEARAFYSMGVLNGLTFFAPQINMAANPLWGRNMECPGEDPFLSATFAYEYVHAFQGGEVAARTGVLKAVATPKHFMGQVFEGDGSNPWNNGTDVNRQSNDTRYSLRDLEQYYLPSFKAAMVDAGAGSVMCAYQGVNGAPMCANGFLLNRVVREGWGWEGFVVSDCDAIKTMMVKGSPGGNPSFGHAFSLTGAMAVQDGVRAGCDSNCGDPYGAFGAAAIKDGLVTEQQLDASVRRLLRPMFQLGLFDPPAGQPFTGFNWSHVGTAAHRQLALEGARQSLVLLQNGEGAAAATAATAAAAAAAVLPLAPGRKLLVAGPLRNATEVLLGNYNGPMCTGNTGDCRESLGSWIAKLNAGGATAFAPGTLDVCDTHPDANATIAAAVAAAKDADVAVLVLGGDCHEGEGTDRDFLHLPGDQQALLDAMVGAGTPLAVVVINGGPFALDSLKGATAGARAVSVLQAGFPGQEGGQAIAEALFGAYNPSGKLTTTVYPAAYANGEPVGGTPWMDASLRPHTSALGTSEGRTHMFYTGEPLFAFGHGLSYTSFALAFEEEKEEGEGGGEEEGGSGAAAVPTAEVPLADAAEVLPSLSWRVRVTNTGAVAGKETVQAYWSPPDEVDADLRRQLFAFEGVFLAPGASATLEFRLPADASKVATVTEGGDRVFLPGLYGVAFTRGHGADAPAAAVRIVGEGSVTLSTFPSPWVEGQQVTVDACVEGLTDVVPHTEDFVVAYKVWDVVELGGAAEAGGGASSGGGGSSQGNVSRVVHRASGRCLSLDAATSFTELRTCNASSAAQAWRHNAAQRSIAPSSGGGCLATSATASTQLRRNVTVAACSAAAAQKWTIEPSTGFIRSNVPCDAVWPLSCEAGLCLAARTEGIYNVGS